MEDEVLSAYNDLMDNATSTLFKIVAFQSDGGNMVTKELTERVLTRLIPITEDLYEAEDLHKLVLQQVLAKNPVLMEVPDLTRECVMRIKEYAEAHPEPESAILCKEGKQLLQQDLNNI